MRTTRTTLTDDITGVGGDDVQTRTFHLPDGKHLTVDLGGRLLVEFDGDVEHVNSVMLRWTIAARPVAAPRKPRTGNPDAAHARAWWNTNHGEASDDHLSDRGRIPAHVWDAWHAAGNPKVGA